MRRVLWCQQLHDWTLLRWNSFFRLFCPCSRISVCPIHSNWLCFPVLHQYSAIMTMPHRNTGVFPELHFPLWMESCTKTLWKSVAPQTLYALEAQSPPYRPFLTGLVGNRLFSQPCAVLSGHLSLTVRCSRFWGLLVLKSCILKNCMEH